METLKGSMENIIFRNDQNGYTVADFDVDGELTTVVGSFDAPQTGVLYVMRGVWVEHPVYGPQFQMQDYSIEMPSSREGLIRYLSSGILPGVGEKKARDIVEHFGDETLDILDNHPDRLLEIKGIGRKTLDTMMEDYQEQREIREVLIELKEYGISTAYALKLYNVYGDRTLPILLDDPYRAARDVRGIGFKAADMIAAKLGVDRDSPARIEAGLVQSLRVCYSRGNTYMTHDELISESQQILGVPTDLIEEQLSDLMMSGMVQIDEIGGEKVYYPLGLFEAEDNTALSMVRLCRSEFSAGDVDIDAIIRDYEKSEEINLDDIQHQAIRTAVESGAAIITGGPGTGKTTIINGVLRVLKAMGMKVRLAAPTGRAAKRMAETTGEEAQTIHRLLEYTYSEDETLPSFDRNEGNPIEADAVIIDEASMVDIVLMNSLLSAMTPGMRLILVGDADQLPSVGPGNVLSDLIDSGLIRVIRLTHIYRQSERSMISLNAHRINEGEIPDIDNHSDFVFMRRSDQMGIRKTIIELIQHRLKDAFDIDPLRDIQVISPMKKGTVGVIEMNREIQKILNPPDVDKEEKNIGSVVFREGDKVMQIRNNYQMHWEDAYGPQTGEGVYNGDIGLIRSIDIDEKQLTVQFTDDKIAKYEFDQLDELTHAFAMTVHKSQGSEFPVVIMPMIGGPPSFLNRKLLYTGVTRAKKMIILVGGFNHFVRMINSDRGSERRTALVERIKMYEEMQV